MARVVGDVTKPKRSTRGTRMLEAAVKQLQREAQNDYKTPPSKDSPPKAPPELKRKPRKCQFQSV
ncbi:MAG: hypothetical protein CMB11_10425 [Euryarchaeota archaeon]|nr:hypothetical protein [Euryarchaeota archaeon]|tara:strand:+ start:283 stop:477 length:195 start_codon:yes stop_codon:yes gene_type:complete